MLTPEQKAEMARLRNQNPPMHYKAIGAIFGVSEQRVHQILKPMQGAVKEKREAQQRRHNAIPEVRERRIAYFREWRRAHPNYHREYFQRRKEEANAPDKHERA